MPEATLTVSDILGIINTLVIVVTLFVVWYQTSLLRKQVQDQRNSHEKSLNYTIYHNPRLNEVYTVIDQYFPDWAETKLLMPIKVVLHAIFVDDARSFERRGISLAEAIEYLLSHLEHMGLAARLEVANLDTAYEIQGRDILRAVSIFKEYIQYKREMTSNPTLYKHAVWLALEMQTRMQNDVTTVPELEAALEKIAVPAPWPRLSKHEERTSKIQDVSDKAQRLSSE
jgi:hypothetical protein